MWGSEGGSGTLGGIEALTEMNRALAGRQEQRGCTAGRIPVTSFPPFLTGCKVPGIPLRGAAVHTHFTEVLRAAGGARQWGGEGG